MLADRFVHTIRHLLAAGMLILGIACGQHADKTQDTAKDSGAVVNDSGHLVKDSASSLKDSVATPGKNAVADSAADRVLFAAFFEKFKKAAQQNKEAELGDLLYFPFQTVQWTNDDLQDGTVDKAGGHIKRDEFHKCYPYIFYKEVRQYFGKADLDDLTEYTDLGGQDYYLTLQRLTDKGSPMFEAYVQRDPDVKPGKTTPGNYFGFVFGKVNGAYKAISYYGKWDVKALAADSTQ
jgi:hypothetical protein